MTYYPPMTVFDESSTEKQDNITERTLTTQECFGVASFQEWQQYQLNKEQQ